MPRKKILIIIAIMLMALSVGVTYAGDETLWTTATTPDALIILDRSGSMEELPAGSSGAILHVHGTSCSIGGPFYDGSTGSECVNATSLYVPGLNCSIDGPFSTTNPASIPTGDLYVNGTSCSVDGPFATTKGSQCLNTGTKVYVGGSSCSINGPYYISSGPGHTKSCSVSTYIPTITYTASDCTNGPFYKTTGAGHTTQCTKCTKCTTPFSDVANAYTATDCTNGPFYKTSGTGHTTACPASATCSNPLPVTSYTATDCTSGPFYKTSGTGHTTVCYTCKQCTASPMYSETDTCDGPFYTTSGTGHTAKCSKIEIAKRALYGLLNADITNSSITAADTGALGARLGLLSYYNCSSNASNALAYTNSSSCIKLAWPITQSDNTTATPFANLYCNDTTCASTVTSCTTSSPQNSCIAGFNTGNYTPLAYALREGENYLDYHRTLDASASCRQKSIIIVTDGADTVACSANGSTGASQRRAPVFYAKALAAAGYKVFVVGFGSDMPNDLKNTLNWMAYYGGTRNPNEMQTVVTSPAAVAVGTDPCSNGTDPGSYTLSGYAFLATNPTDLSLALTSAIMSIQEANYSFSSQASIAAARVQEENFIYEASFEPRNNSGTATEPFWPGHLKKYSISTTGDLITPPCWDAGVKLQDMAADDRHMWTYKGAIANALSSFDTTNIQDADLGVDISTTTCGASCTSVVGFYRGNATYNLENWKLGDLFHTNPVAVRTPTQYFYDPRECGGTSFSAFRGASLDSDPNYRTSANGKQLILAGANDGQLHAFRTGNNSSDCSGGGDEVWSFIPPNLLQKMVPIAHNSHTNRTTLHAHNYFVDGPIQVSDVWLPATPASGTSKNDTDWKTLAVFSEGQGSGAYLWSSSPTCYSTSTSGGFSDTYSATNYPYYCGIYALDVTNTLTANRPTYLWKLNPTAAQAPYLAEAWSKMQIGRVKIAGNERWVGFIGGGYSASSCLSIDGATSTACNTPATNSPGKGFFVVDLKDGTILWSFTHGSSTTSTTSPNMDFSAPAAPLPLDLDNDGFIDTVYMGDLGGNMWRFRLCPRDPYCSSCGLSSYTSSPCTSCSTTSWTGSRLYSATNAERGSGLVTASNTHKQIFTAATATKDPVGNVWVYFGTGENNDPTWRPPTGDPDTSTTKNRLFGIKEDSNFTATYATTDLTNITASPSYDATTATTHGWYINLSTNTLTRSDNTTITSPLGEKMISDPTVFGGVVYFTTYVPDQGTASACGLSGDAFLYGIRYLSGAGAFSNSSRTQYVGHGIGSSPIISMRPGSTSADIYATASGGAGTAALTQKLGETPTTASMTNILYWKDKRLQ